MARPLVKLRGWSLNWLRQEYAHRFYPQTWLDREAFACTTYRGAFPITGDQPAAVLVKAWLDGYLDELNDKFKWTSDVDHNGDPVYIGMAGEYPGLQIHRHIQIDSRWVA